MHNLWQSSLPSRFVDELPKDFVTVETSDVSGGAFAGYSAGYGQSRFAQDFASSDYNSPGWRRAKSEEGRAHFKSRGPDLDIQADLIATSDPSAASFRKGERVFHQKFGYGEILLIDGNKLTIEFEKAGRKKVIDSFVERH